MALSSAAYQHSHAFPLNELQIKPNPELLELINDTQHGFKKFANNALLIKASIEAGGRGDLEFLKVLFKFNLCSEKALIKSIQNHQYETAFFLIEKNQFDVNDLDKLLRLAVQQTGHKILIHKLLQKGAKFESPLHQEAFEGNIDKFKDFPTLLLEKKAEETTCLDYLCINDKETLQLLDFLKTNKKLDFSICNFLYKSAIRLGKNTILNWLFEHAPEHLELTTYFNMDAVINGHLEILQLITKKMPPSFSKDLSELFACATEHGHLNILQWIFDRQPDVLNYTNHHEMNVWLIAAENGHLHIMKWLYEMYNKGFAINITKKDDSNNSAIYIATKTGQLHIIHWLKKVVGMSIEQPVIDKEFILYNNVIECAIDNHQLLVAQWLINQDGLDINILNSTLMYIIKRISNYNQDAIPSIKIGILGEIINFLEMLLDRGIVLPSSTYDETLVTAWDLSNCLPIKLEQFFYGLAKECDVKFTVNDEKLFHGIETNYLNSGTSGYLRAFQRLGSLYLQKTGLFYPPVEHKNAGGKLLYLLEKIIDWKQIMNDIGGSKSFCENLEKGVTYLIKSKKYGYEELVSVAVTLHTLFAPDEYIKNVFRVLIIKILDSLPKKMQLSAENHFELSKLFFDLTVLFEKYDISFCSYHLTEAIKKAQRNENKFLLNECKSSLKQFLNIQHSLHDVKINDDKKTKTKAVETPKEATIPTTDEKDKCLSSSHLKM